MLHKFADKFEEYYGRHNVTMNLHLIRHIANSVLQLGPLWAQPKFTFETNNGVLAKPNHAKKDFLQSLSWKYVMKSKLERKAKEIAKLIIGKKIFTRIDTSESKE